MFWGGEKFGEGRERLYQEIQTECVNDQRKKITWSIGEVIVSCMGLEGEVVQMGVSGFTKAGIIDNFYLDNEGPAFLIENIELNYEW